MLDSKDQEQEVAVPCSMWTADQLVAASWSKRMVWNEVSVSISALSSGLAGWRLVELRRCGYVDEEAVGDAAAELVEAGRRSAVLVAAQSAVRRRCLVAVPDAVGPCAWHRRRCIVPGAGSSERHVVPGTSDIP